MGAKQGLDALPQRRVSLAGIDEEGGALRRWHNHGMFKNLGVAGSSHEQMEFAVGGRSDGDGAPSPRAR